MIDQHGPIAQSEPVQAASGQGKVLMGCQPPHRHAGEGELEADKGGGSVRQGEVHQGIGLALAVVQMQQGQDGIHDRANNQKRECHSPARDNQHRPGVPPQYADSRDADPASAVHSRVSWGAHVYQAAGACQAMVVEEELAP
jgi:hypothetical protein